jgi:hypothetical protein
MWELFLHSQMPTTEQTKGKDESCDLEGQVDAAFSEKTRLIQGGMATTGVLHYQTSVF